MAALNRNVCGANLVRPNDPLGGRPKVPVAGCHHANPAGRRPGRTCFVGTALWLLMRQGLWAGRPVGTLPLRANARGSPAVRLIA